MNIIALFEKSIELKASDLHLSSGTPPILRIDGDLVRLENTAVIENSWLKDSLAKIFPAERTDCLEYDFSFTLFDSIRCRVNIFQQSRGTSAAFRFISHDVPTLDSLMMPPILKSLSLLKNGLLLVTGSTGSGKTSTVAAMIQNINQHKASHIITMEDPIEYVYNPDKSLIQQREIHQHTNSFQSALRAALREDPDVIVVGELRDLETIRLALTAAETGHLVIATLHTHSCATSVNRIIDVFPSEDKALVRNMLSESLQGVISQTLVKKIGGGRIAAQEIMIGNPAIRHLIRENKTTQITSVIQTNQANGMRTMEDSLKDLYVKKLIDHSSLLTLRSSS